jgi:uncharacterized protein YkwD
MRRPVLISGIVGLMTVVAGVVVATTANAGTSTYEAEDASNTIGGGARVVGCDRCSAGDRVTGIGNSGVLTFNGIIAERTGSTRVNITYSGTERRTALLSVNGGVGAAINFPATRSIGRPANLRVRVTLTAGPNTVTFSNPSGPAPDLDKLAVATDGTPPLAIPTATLTAAPTTAESDAPSAGASATSSSTLPGSPESPSPTGPSGTGPASTDPSSTDPASTGPSSTDPSATSPSAPAQPSATAPPSGNAELETAVLQLVNAERTKAGCSALAANDQLTAAARGHSADMAARNFFSHTTPEGVTFVTRINNAGYRWSGLGENIAMGQRNPVEVMASWMDSAGHKANILNCDFKDLGVGVAANATGSLLWTQDFGSPR